MKKRILSLVLAIVMCFSMFTFSVAVEAATLAELMELYKERIWDWQEYQFDAMTDEQSEVIDNAWTSYEANKDGIRALAEEFVDEVLEGNDEFYATETMKDLYKWKLMRDIMEEKLEITNEEAEYADWLARFTAFEEANDEAISASAPMAALNGLGDYSAELTEYFGELAGLVDNNGLVFTGEGEAKATAYVNAFDQNGDGKDEDDDMASVMDYLKADVKELMVDGLVNGFDIGMQLATNQVNRENTEGVFDMILDRDMKAAFLLVGEDLTRYALDLVPGLRGDLLELDKKDIVAAVVGDATPILGGNNKDAVVALYDTMDNISAYMLADKIDKIELAEEKVLSDLGIDVADVSVKATEKLEAAMELIDENHGLELVHLNTYLGRALLRYIDGEELPYLAGAEIDGNAVTELALGFAHNRYPVFSSLNEYGIASFDANYDADGIKVYAGEGIGQIMIEVTDEADGTAEVKVYRGYTDEDQDGAVDNEENVYRYVTTFTVKTDATADTTVTVDKAPTVDDPTVDVSGETDLDEVKITVKDEDGNEVEVEITDKDGNVLDPDAVSKEDFEGGIVIVLPDGVEAGDKFTVEVKDPADDSVLDSEDVTVGEAVEGPYVTLEDVLDTTIDGTIEVKGETNLDYVTVAIVKPVEDGVKTIYAVVYSKAEFEAGITLNAPDNAAEGDVYTVVVGTEQASASDEFAIEGADLEYEVVLDDVLNTTADGTITVKGTTNLDYVTVAIVKPVEDGVKTVYAVVYEKAEFEAGIEIAAPDNAQVGEVYTVVVGTEKASDSDEFTIVDEVVEYEITLEDIADFKLSENANAEVTVKGTTNLDYVVVSITLNGDEVYTVVHTKAEYEAGIAIKLDNAAVGNVYTVAVGQEGTEAEDTFEVLPETDMTVDKTPTADDPTVGVSGTTDLDEVKITVKDEDGNEVDVTIKDKDGNVLDPDAVSKEDFEAGIEIVLPEGVKPGDKFTVEVKDPADDSVLDSEDVTVKGVSGTLSLAGSTTRTASVNGKVTITTTPQNIYPEGATVEVVWTTENGEIIEVTSTAGDYNNIATITKLKKGTEKVTATLYVNGVAVDSKTVTIKNKSNPGPSTSDKPYTSITVKVDETKDITKAPTTGKDVEFIPESGSGEVKVEIVDGVITVTGVKEGTVKGQLVVKNENGNVVSTRDYEFIVTEGDTKPVDHECEWPDIAAGWEGKADAHWAHLTIDAMTINGYIKGYPDGLFKPDQNITRAEFSAIVYRILGLEDSEDGVYYDDTKGHWAEELIATMSLPEGYGMTRGYGDGNFGPNDYITREQAVAIIARAKSSVWVEAEEGAKDVFTDSEDISWWFDGEMDAAVTNGLITGYEDGSYKPLGFTTRAEACTLLARAWPEVLELN